MTGPRHCVIFNIFFVIARFKADVDFPVSLVLYSLHLITFNGELHGDIMFVSLTNNKKGDREICYCLQIPTDYYYYFFIGKYLQI